MCGFAAGRWALPIRMHTILSAPAGGAFPCQGRGAHSFLEKNPPHTPEEKHQGVSIRPGPPTTQRGGGAPPPLWIPLPEIGRGTRFSGHSSYPLGVGFQRRGPGPPAFVPRGGMGDGGVPHVSGGGLRGRYLCAKDTSSLPCSGNYPLREHGGQCGRRFRHLRSPGPHVSNRFPPWGHAKRPGPRLLADRGVMKPERLISSRCSWG